MNILLFNDPQKVSAQEWMSDCAALPEWRRQRAMFYRFLVDRVLCTKAYMLLREGLRMYYGITGNPEFEYVGYGKPVLKEHSYIHFNLSHCRKGVLCVLDDAPVGCDIEEIVEKPDIDVMRRCFNKREIETILRAPNPCVEFTRLWTIKEAVLKLTGEGISDALPSLLTAERMEGLDLTTTVDEEHGYVYSICRLSCPSRA